MNTHGQLPARRRNSLKCVYVIGAVLLTALWTIGQAQGSRGDIRFTLTGGAHDGEYVLSDVPLFLCGFGYVHPGSYSLQYYADDPTSEPSMVQLNHAGQGDALPEGVAELLIAFGDISDDGVTYMINLQAELGSGEVTVLDEGDSATMTVEGETFYGVKVVLESVCRGVGRF